MVVVVGGGVIVLRLFVSTVKWLETLRPRASAQTFHRPCSLSKGSPAFMGCRGISQKHLPSLSKERK